MKVPYGFVQMGEYFPFSEWIRRSLRWLLGSLSNSKHSLVGRLTAGRLTLSIAGPVLDLPSLVVLVRDSESSASFIDGQDPGSKRERQAMHTSKVINALGVTWVFLDIR